MKKLMMSAATVVLAAGCGESDPAGTNPSPPPPPPTLGTPPGDVGFNIIDDAFVDDQGRRNDEASVTVTASQMVGWLHEGANVHTVSFTSVPAGAIANDSGNMDNGATFVQTLATPGTYVFRCDTHPTTMLDATIIVN
ncbi:MAG: plastocyanin/azurin family copper-binding protein [Gemmatimonadetes bacterium]|nr:plastocyanin/azurin family copper-binding protein [Gemmatimonadota bacterium]